MIRMLYFMSSLYFYDFHQIEKSIKNTYISRYIFVVIILNQIMNMIMITIESKPNIDCRFIYKKAKNAFSFTNLVLTDKN